MKNILYIITLIILGASSVIATESPIAQKISGQKCNHGLLQQPNGPFAVTVFCEDALGTYIGVICYAAGKCERSEYPDGSIRFEGWALNNRFWQEKIWASDVDSIAWSPNKKSLFVATGRIYGSGSLYQLDLEKRKVKQLLPIKSETSTSNPGPGYSIINLSNDGRTLSYKIQQPDGKVANTLKLAIESED